MPGTTTTSALVMRRNPAGKLEFVTLVRGAELSVPEGALTKLYGSKKERLPVLVVSELQAGKIEASFLTKDGSNNYTIETGKALVTLPETVLVPPTQPGVFIPPVAAPEVNTSSPVPRPGGPAPGVVYTEPEFAPVIASGSQAQPPASPAGSAASTETPFPAASSEAEYANCTKCDRLIPSGPDTVSCPFCGAPVETQKEQPAETPQGVNRGIGPQESVSDTASPEKPAAPKITKEILDRLPDPIIAGVNTRELFLLSVHSFWEANAALVADIKKTGMLEVNPYLKPGSNEYNIHLHNGIRDVIIKLANEQKTHDRELERPLREANKRALRVYSMIAEKQGTLPKYERAPEPSEGPTDDKPDFRAKPPARPDREEAPPRKPAKEVTITQETLNGLPEELTGATVGEGKLKIIKAFGFWYTYPELIDYVENIHVLSDQEVTDLRAFSKDWENWTWRGPWMGRTLDKARSAVISLALSKGLEIPTQSKTEIAEPAEESTPQRKRSKAFWAAVSGGIGLGAILAFEYRGEIGSAVTQAAMAFQQFFRNPIVDIVAAALGAAGSWGLPMLSVKPRSEWVVNIAGLSAASNLVLAPLVAGSATDVAVSGVANGNTGPLVGVAVGLVAIITEVSPLLFLRRRGESESNESDDESEPLPEPVYGEAPEQDATPKEEASEQVATSQEFCAVCTRPISSEDEICTNCGTPTHGQAGLKEAEGQPVSAEEFLKEMEELA